MKKLIFLLLIIIISGNLFAQKESLTDDLFSAFQSNELDRVKELIEEGADVNGLSYQKETPLHYASRKKNAKEIIRLLIDKGAKIDAKNSSGDTPLHFACGKYGNTNTAKLLIEIGADVNTKDNYDNTPLHELCRNDNTSEIAILLIESGADINAKNREGETPLLTAFYSGSINNISILIDKGADINMRDNKGNTALILECRKENSFNTVKFLVEKGAEINVRNENGNCPLILAFEKDTSLGTAKFLINNGADINVKGGYSNNSTLHLCYRNETGFELAKQLIEKGINVNERNNRGETPLFSVLYNKNSYEFAKLLIDNGANVLETNKYGYTPLHYVLSYETAKLFIESGADVNAKSTDNSTPLNSACFNSEDVELVKLFIEQGADLNTSGRWGDTPLISAFRSENFNPDIIKLLIEKGADVTLKNDDGYTALHFCRNLEIAKLLIEKGADVNAKDDHGRSPICNCSFEKTKLLLDNGAIIKDDLEDDKLLYYPVRNNNIEFAKLLMKNGADINAKIDRYKLLTYAVKNEFYEIANLLIENGAEINPENFNDYSPLSYAIINKNYELTQLLIEKGANIDIINKDRNAPVHLAMEIEDDYFIKLLIEKGADLDILSYDGFTPLCFLINKGKYDLAKLIIEKGADVNISVYEKSYYSFYTPLHFAVENNSIDMTNLLINNGAYIDAQDMKYYTPLHSALRDEHFEIAKILIEQGSDLYLCVFDPKDKYSGFTPLHFACNNDKNLELVKLLIKKGADINGFCECAYTPLHIAMKNNNKKLSQFLILKGADVNVPVLEFAENYPGYTPLHFAAKNKNNLDIAELLLKKGADIFASDINKNTPLHIAARYDNSKIALLLYETESGLEIINSNGHTPKITAKNFSSKNVYNFLQDTEKYKIFPLYASLRYKELLEILKKDPKLKFLINGDNQTLLHLIIKDKNEKLFKRLINKDILNVRNSKNESLLFYSLLTGNTKFAEILIKKGADVNLPDKLGKTPLSIAQSRKYENIIRSLKEKGAKHNKSKPKLVLPIGHTGGVHSTCYSPDGKFILSGSADETILLWEVKSGKEIKVFKGHSSPVNAVAFSPDGNFFISGDYDGKIILWEISTGIEIIRYKGHSDENTYFSLITSLSFSPDGKHFVSASYDMTMRLWNTSNENQVGLYKGHSDFIYSVAFVSDSEFLSCSGDKIIKLWNIEKAEVIRSFIGHKGRVNAISLSSNKERFLSASENNEIKLWDIKSGKELKTFKGHWMIRSLAFSPDNKHFATGSIWFDALYNSNDVAVMKLWDIETGKIVYISGNNSHNGIMSLDFSKDGNRIIAGIDDNTIREWNVNDQKEIQIYKGHTNKIQAIYLTPNNKCIIKSKGGFDPAEGRYKNYIKLWNITDQKGINLFDAPELAYGIESLSRNGKYFICGSPGYTITLSETLTGKKIKSYGKDSPLGKEILYTSDNKYFLSASYKNLNLYELASGNIIRTFKGHTSGINSFSFSNDEKYIATGSYDKTIKIWEYNSGENIKTFTLKHDVSSVKYSPDNKYLVSVSGKRNVNLWDIKSGNIISSYILPNDINSIEFSPDGKYLLTGYRGWENIVRLWDISAGKEIWKIESSKFYPQFTNDSKFLIYSNKNKIVSLNINNGEISKRFVGHKGIISAIDTAFSLNYIISGSFDNTIKLWNYTSGEIIHTFKGHTQEIVNLSFINEGKFIISSSVNNTIKLWSTETKKELATIIIIGDRDWVVLNPDGLFDATPGAVTKMHYIAGLEIIELNQLKDRYYEPGLLRKIIKEEKLRDVQGFNDIKLPPDIELLPILHGSFDIKLKNKFNGGIGRTQIFVNGKEIIDDARRYSSIYKTENDLKVIQEKDSLQLSVNITGFERYFLPNKENIISVRAYNGENYIISRPEIIKYTPTKKDVYDKNLIPDVYILSIGTSEYYNSGLNLRFAAKDARDIATGLQIAANRLFGEDKVHTYLFTSPISDEMKMINGKVTKDNFNNVFEEIGYNITADDIVIVYLAGHGMNIDSEGDGGDFYYLTQDAHSNEFSAYSDLVIREKETLAGSDIIKLMNKLPANKQVLIIDACHSGKAVENLMASRDMSSGTIRALDRMRDRTGMHIITGSTADAVSYESNQFGQGILTYSLLEGLKGASLKEGRFVDVMLWFQNAKNRVPDLASGLGGIQDPVIFSPYVEGKYKEGAESFEIGELNSEDKELIPLAKSKPIFVLSIFQDSETFDDHLKISDKIDEKLRDFTAMGSNAPVILIETRNFPSAYKLRGQYQIQEDKIILKINLFKGKDIIKSFEFSGNNSEIDAMNQKMIDEILLMKI